MEARSDPGFFVISVISSYKMCYVNYNGGKYVENPYGLIHDIPAGTSGRWKLSW